jgi:hexokinase
VEYPLNEAWDLLGLDFVVGRLCEFLDQNGIKDTSGLLLGFSFAFTTEKASLSHGKLLSWSKGFSVQGAVGMDVVALLQAALDKAHVNLKCNALINDVGNRPLVT